MFKLWKNEKINIRIVLTGQIAGRFMELKRFKGIQTHSELIRNLITEAYRNLPPQSLSPESARTMILPGTVKEDR